MKKYCLDLTVTEQVRLHKNHVLLKLTHSSPLPKMLPGQFAEIRVDKSPTTFLRRPISINNVESENNEVWFLIQLVGDGTRTLAELTKGDTLNVVLPLPQKTLKHLRIFFLQVAELVLRLCST